MNCANHPAVVEGVFHCSRCGVPYCRDCVITLQGRLYCAKCKGEQLIDIRSGVDATEVRLAGIGRRFAAIWVDGLIIGLPLMIVIFATVIPAMIKNTNQPPPPMFGFTGLAGYLTAPIYVIYEALMLKARGQTVGKMALGIKVVQASGQTISTGQAWGRAVVRALFISFLSIINYAPAFFTKEKTCIHDMAAKTRVVLVQ